MKYTIVSAQLFLPRDIDQKGGCNTDRRVGPDDRTEEESESEPLQALRPEEEHREHDDEDSE